MECYVCNKINYLYKVINAEQAKKIKDDFEV